MGSCLDCYSSESDETTPILQGGSDPFRRSVSSSTWTPKKPINASVRRQFHSTIDVPGTPTDRRWYHGAIGDREAESRLKAVAQRNGTYLVYDLKGCLGSYVLVVYQDRKIYRIRISRRLSDGKYILGEEVAGSRGYDSVRSLIEHHRGVTGKPFMVESRRIKLSDYVFVPKQNE